VRRAIHANFLTENFIFKEIHNWASEKDPKYEYCALSDYEAAGKENNCHEFMAYAMIKAIEDLEARIGTDIN